MDESAANGNEAGTSAGTSERNVTVEQRDNSPSLVVRAVYFLLIGWWASGIWLGVAWLLNLTIIGMPLGIKMINLVPKVVSLKERTIETRISENEFGEITVSESGNQQHSLVVRAVYFLLIGWWLSGLWLSLAWLASITIVGLPVAVWLYDRLPYVVSLYKY